MDCPGVGSGCVELDGGRDGDPADVDGNAEVEPALEAELLDGGLVLVPLVVPAVELEPP